MLWFSYLEVYHFLLDRPSNLWIFKESRIFANIHTKPFYIYSLEIIIEIMQNMFAKTKRI